MVPLTSLVVPIVLSAIVVFFASFVIHMVLTYHRTDMVKMPDAQEDAILDAVRRLNLPPGDYGMPHPGSPDRMRDPAFLSRMTKGPTVFLTVAPGAPPSLGKNLAQWFVHVVIVTTFAAYVTGRALAPGTDYLTVFRFIGTTGFMGYALGAVPESIWYKRAWSRTMKQVFDGLVYASLSAGVFGWLWPQ
jgi:hypothetical protein